MQIKEKVIKGFDNYTISHNGVVINKKTMNTKNPYINKDNGYLYVDLWKNNKSYKRPKEKHLLKRCNDYSLWKYTQVSGSAWLPFFNGMKI